MNTPNEQYPPNYPQYGFHMCHGCGNMAPHHSQENASDNGWELPYNTFGYYGGFSDSEQDYQEQWRLCHECVVKFLETFPLLGILMGKGLHSIIGPTDIPCCKWAWRGTDIFGKWNEGQRKPGVHVQIANEEGGWDNTDW